MIKLFKKEIRPKPIKIVVTLDDHEGTIFKKEIDIPEGYTFNHRIACDELIGKEGERNKLYTWRAGYSITYEYKYHDQES